MSIMSFCLRTTTFKTQGEVFLFCLSVSQHGLGDKYKGFPFFLVLVCSLYSRTQNIDCSAVFSGSTDRGSVFSGYPTSSAETRATKSQ